MMVRHGAKVAFMFLCCMKTVKDVFVQYKAGLAEVYEPLETDAITTLVLSDLMDKSNAQLKAFPESEIDNSIKSKLEHVLTELQTGRPVQYILGHTEFYGLPFNVSPAVLLPRPETEELVQWIIQTVNASSTPINTLLDIGTGSGCIPITIKKQLPNLKVFAIDISSDALYIAKTNAALNNVEI